MPFPLKKASLKLPDILAAMKDPGELPLPKLKKAKSKLTPASASRIRTKANAMMGASKPKPMVSEDEY